jgi:hypothetical protein
MPQYLRGDGFTIAIELGREWAGFTVDMNEAAGHLWQGLRQAMHEAGRIMVRRAREESPKRAAGVGYLPGTLASAIYYKVISPGDQVRLFMDRDVAPYGPALDEGGPQEGWDIEGDPLRFVLNGRVVYARKVHHPAFKPRYFMRRAARLSYPEVKQLLVARVQEAFARGPRGFVKR